MRSIEMTYSKITKIVEKEHNINQEEVPHYLIRPLKIAYYYDIEKIGEIKKICSISDTYDKVCRINKRSEEEIKSWDRSFDTSTWWDIKPYFSILIHNIPSLLILCLDYLVIKPENPPVPTEDNLLTDFINLNNECPLSGNTSCSLYMNYS